tara:strand:+ start:605 stop:775 length:171 start_codon:yes stop_codon:yes gene_type:complete
MTHGRMGKGKVEIGTRVWQGTVMVSPARELLSLATGAGTVPGGFLDPRKLVELPGA